MVAVKKRGHPSRVTFKARVSLFPGEWEELRMEAQSRGITGGELISAILSEWVANSGSTFPDGGDDDPSEDA